VEVKFHALLYTALDGNEWSAERFGHFISRETAANAHYIESCVELDVVNKNGRALPSLAVRSCPVHWPNSRKRQLTKQFDCVT
jgi:hypothetical protein